MRKIMYGILNKTAIALLLACMMPACKDDYRREIPELNVEGESSYDVPREGGVYYLTVRASEQFTAPSTKIWCKTEILAAEGANNVRITVEPNSGYVRDAEVSIVVYSLPGRKVTIHQDGDDPTVIVPAGPQITASWQFNSASHPGKASIGADLQLIGDGFTAVAGANGTKGVRVASGSYFLAAHGIPANGNGLKVNEYTILIDYRLPELNKWYCFLQTDPENQSDGEIFIRPSGELTNSNIGYSEQITPQDAGWHRLVISCKIPEYCKFYIDGKLFFEGKVTALSTDNRYALDPGSVAFFADEDGEDSPIDISEITVWDQSLEDAGIEALGAAGSSEYLPRLPLAGSWTFEDPEHWGLADTGPDLLTEGGGFTAVAGPDNGNQAVRVASGAYFKLLPDMAPNGSSPEGAAGTKINEYTLLFDYRLPELNKWYCFLQTDPENGNDGEIFIRPSGELTNSNIGYSEKVTPQDAGWHRLVMVCKSPEYCRFYIDGQLFFEGKTGALALDNRYALDPAGIVFCGDEDGEDSPVDIAEIALWRLPLTAEQVAALGTAGTPYPALNP
ncbi:MAG: hypothetical protein LBP50_02585 [Tannerella sp.]|jgi:hypothetical protein|nr:hypothetical protein [Tannerella sp.]